MPLQFVKSTRGKDHLVHNGYRYLLHFSKPGPNSEKIWYCVEKRRNKCSGRAYSVKDELSRINDDHNHPPDTVQIEIKEIHAKVKEAAKTTSGNPEEILASCIEGASSLGQLPKLLPRNMKRAILRVRGKSQNALPIPVPNPSSSSTVPVPEKNTPTSCIICYKPSNGISGLHWKETLKEFFPLLERYLDADNSSDEELVTLAPFDNLINAGMVSCEVCWKVVNSFCELNQRMKSIELKLNSKLRTLEGIMDVAETVTPRKKGFVECAKKLEMGDEASVKDLVDWVFRYKLELVKKCMLKLETLPSTNRPGRDDQIGSNYPPASLDTTSPSWTLEEPTIVKYEPLEPEASEWELEESAIDQLLGDRGDFSEIPDLPETDAPSPMVENYSVDVKVGQIPVVIPPNVENDNEGEAEADDGQIPDEVEIPLPLIVTSGVDMGTPRSIIDPQTGIRKCSQCSTEFKKVKNFKRHYDSIHLKLRYKCTLCDKELNRPEHYKRHYENAHTGKIRCPKCNKLCATKGILEKHLQLHLHHGPKSSKPRRSTTVINPKTGKRKCPLCPTEFEDLEGSLDHYKTVHVKYMRMRKCPVCKKNLSSSKEQVRHYRTIHLGDIFECPRCFKRFHQRGKLLRHQKQKDNCIEPEARPKLPMRFGVAEGQIPPPVIISSDISTENVGTPHSIVNRETGKVKCSFCLQEFKDKKYFRRHCNDVHVSNVRYICASCDKEFNLETDYQKHYQAYHTAKVKCSFCDKMFTKVQLAIHKRLIHGSKSAKLRRYVNASINLETGKHKCPLCPSEFDDVESSFDHHEKVHHDNELKCLVCEKIFKSNAERIRHYRTIHLGESFRCPRCSKCFTRKYTLSCHQRDYCGGNPVVVKVEGPKPKRVKKKPTGPKPICDQCGATFAYTSALRLHLKSVHLQIRDHVCETCGKGFSSPMGLKRHVDSIHLKLKEFTCDMCGKAFGRKEYLQLHVNTVHLNLKEHICHVCGKGYGQRCELRKHIKKSHHKYLTEVI